jgi:hypothetical protein
MQTSEKRVKWTISEKRSSGDQFESLRLSCFTPASMCEPDNSDFYLYQGEIQQLYRLRRANEHCPICLETGDTDCDFVDSMTLCTHVCCFECYETYFKCSMKKVKGKLISKCPVCKPDYSSTESCTYLCVNEI